MGCPYLKIEGQSCLVGSVDRGLMKNRQIDLWGRVTQKRARKKHFSHILPIATLPGIFQQITPKKRLQTFRPNYRLSIVIGLTLRLFSVLPVGRLFDFGAPHPLVREGAICYGLLPGFFLQELSFVFIFYVV